MQFYYAIGYDTDKKKWFVEHDTSAYFSDGNVWASENVERFGFGWSFPEGDEEILDQTLLNTLNDILVSIPIPREA